MDKIQKLNRALKSIKRQPGLTKNDYGHYSSPKLEKREETQLIVIHCSATNPSMDVGAREIDQWHKDRGWLGIGYQLVIRRDGTIENGRHIDSIGAHARGYNEDSIGICLIGGVDAQGKPEDNFTKEQYAALNVKLHELRSKYPIKKIVGHRDLPGVAKACPSFEVHDFLVRKGLEGWHSEKPDARDLPPEIKKIEKSITSSKTVGGSTITLGLLTSVISFAKGIPFFIGIGILLFAGLIFAYQVRERMQKAEAIKQYRQGDDVITLQKDMFDHLYEAFWSLVRMIKR